MTVFSAVKNFFAAAEAATITSEYRKRYLDHLNQNQLANTQNALGTTQYNNMLVQQPNTAVVPYNGYPIGGVGIAGTLYADPSNTYLLNMGKGAAIQTLQIQPTPQPTAKTWFFNYVALVEDHPTEGATIWPYDDRVHKLLDRRKFNQEKVDLVAVITWCLCNSIQPDKVIDQFETLGAQWE